jgi:hypothetical protein
MEGQTTFPEPQRLETRFGDLSLFENQSFGTRAFNNEKSRLSLLVLVVLALIECFLLRLCTE